MQTMQTTQIHTDGSCHGNPGPGGWAAVILTPSGNNITRRGGSPETTNNRMELTAAIQGLRALRDIPETQGRPVVLHSDSKYLTDAFNKFWITNWQNNGWRNASRKPVANREFWEELAALAMQHSITWQWVKGHSGDQFNELCDRIANEEADRFGVDPVEPPAATPAAAPVEAQTAAQTGCSPLSRDEFNAGYESARQDILRFLAELSPGRPPGLGDYIDGFTE